MDILSRRKELEGFLATLGSCPETLGYSDRQASFLLDIWTRLVQRVPEMPAPTAGLDTYGTGYFLWTPAGYTFEVEVDQNGKCSWFYRDVTRDDSGGAEDQDQLPDSVLDWVAGHHSTVFP